MNKKTYWKIRHGYLWGAVLAFFALCFTGCKDDDVDAGAPFDPSKPIVISDFMPKSGGYGSNLILYGENFGYDASKIQVTVGGKTARIINTKGTSLYCVVPSGAYDSNDESDIQISGLDENGEVVTTAEAAELFTYEKKWLVSTFLGTRYEDSSKFEEKDGPFNDCGGFPAIYCLSFDPKSNYDQLYFVCHNNKLRKIDFTTETVSSITIGGQYERGFAINWTEDEDRNMVVSDDTGQGSSKPGGYILSRNDDGSNNGWSVSMNLPNAESVNGAPSGDYAYLMQENQHYIARVTYNEQTKTFENPLPMAGQDGSAGWVDGVGTKAKMNKPGQGVFVKNPDYAGQEDEYDFYFCDENNHCIRILTPQGRVTTFAGRGNNSTSGGYAEGELRTEARFNTPIAIAYDEKRETFYIGDSGNKVIRSIVLQ